MPMFYRANRSYSGIGLSYCLAFIFSILISGQALADQAVYVETDKARAAYIILKDKQVLREFCEPCGSIAFREIEIDSIQIKKSKTSKEHAISINGDRIDLAYTYVEDGNGGWKNLASLLNVEIDSPIFEYFTENFSDELADFRFIPMASSIIEKCDNVIRANNSDVHTHDDDNAAYQGVKCLEESIVENLSLLSRATKEDIRQTMDQLRNAYRKLQEDMFYNVEKCGISCGSIFIPMPNTQTFKLYELILTDIIEQRKYHNVYTPQ
ncbi:hypothetical protein V5T82_17685 [Magnetovibrio sp. PR-2]|uniref:hypothetical protein n=1 Tax=Magnetovibrio sp. PR-2 TaxID=3120356 RepID=UPI002FCE4023